MSCPKNDTMTSSKIRDSPEFELGEPTIALGKSSAKFMSLRSEVVFCISLFMSQITAVSIPARLADYTANSRIGIFCVGLQSDRTYPLKTICDTVCILNLAIDCLCLNNRSIFISLRASRGDIWWETSLPYRSLLVVVLDSGYRTLPQRSDA